MNQILVLEYSQSGDVTKVADAFTRPLVRAGTRLHRETIRPVVPYPSPWGSLRRLFAVFPECFVGPSCAIHPPGFRPDDRFDLVVLAYQVWHLAPSLPVQTFLTSDHARVLKDTPVITLLVGRNMWHSASETMKGRLRDLGAIHLDNIVVTHQGPPFATFVSVPRALLYGKRDRLWGIFPPAELSAEALDRVERLGAAVAARLDGLGPPYHPLLAGLGAVAVRRRSIVPELVGRALYRRGAHLIARLSAPGGSWRQVLVGVFMLLMVFTILVGIPVGVLVTLLLHPVLRGRIDRYAQQLAAPSGEARPQVPTRGSP